MTQGRAVTIVCLVGFALSMASCAGDDKAPNHRVSALTPIPQPTMDDTAPKDYPGIHNAVAYRDGFISGSVPEGDVGFETLAAMGVKTIISVDGAMPDVDAAERLGMRYIHLPIGYNGFSDERKLELVRATRDSMEDGSVYIHCHHGKHRSAGAAATVAASLGWDTPEGSVGRMKVSGTSPSYEGLYSCAQNATLLSVAVVDAVPANFPSISKPSSFVQSMVDADHALEHLKLIEKAGWKTPADHPDLVPVAEAGRLADLLRLGAESSTSKRKPAAFAEHLLENGRLAQTLEDMLDRGSADGASLSNQLKLVSASCKDCHTLFRD